MMRVSKEVDFWKLFDWDIDFLGGALIALLLVVLDRRAEIRVIFHGAIDESDTLILKLFTVADFSGIRTSTLSIIGRRRW